MNVVEMLVFVAYFLFMLGIGVFFFLKSKDAGEKDYFLGGRNMGAWVSAHLRLRHRPDLDRHRPGHRLCPELDF